MKLVPLLALITGATLAEVADTQSRRSSCGQSNGLLSMSRNFGRIVGGQPVTDCTVIPWQAHLIINRSGRSYQCGGSIISNRHILTAAHCVHSENDVTVHLASTDTWNTDDEEVVAEVKEITEHPDFNRLTLVNDIAVLTLKNPIEYNSCRSPICLDDGYDFNGKTCIVSGYGNTKYNGLPERYLKMVKVQTYDGPNCESEFGIPKDDYLKKTDHMICAGHKKGEKDSCDGDSGGPLVCWDGAAQHFVQVGIVSDGEGCGEPDYPGIYIKVSYFRNWIEKTMKENP